MDDIDELVNWQMEKQPRQKVWRGCRNDHAWEDYEDNAESRCPFPTCLEPMQ